MMIKIKIKLN